MMGKSPDTSELCHHIPLCCVTNPCHCAVSVTRALQAARLLAAFREFKRRESVGLVPYYANKLAALEEALLGARWVVGPEARCMVAHEFSLLMKYCHECVGLVPHTYSTIPTSWQR